MAESTRTPPPAAAKNDTTFCALGKLRVDEADKEKLAVGVLIDNNQLMVRLSDPAPLGNALTIGRWLANSWDTEIGELLVLSKENGKYPSQAKVKKADVKKHLDGLRKFPTEITNFLATLMVARITVTDLDIRHWKTEQDKEAKNAFKFGVAIDFTDPKNPKEVTDDVIKNGEDGQGGLQLFGDLVLEEIKLGIISTPHGEKTFEGPPPKLPFFEVLAPPKEAQALPKPGEKSAATTTDKPVDKATDKPADKATDKPAVKAVDKATDKPAAKPADKATDKPADNATDKPAE